MKLSEAKLLKSAAMGFLFVLAAQVSEARSCGDLSQDLRSMQKAQDSLLQSMVRKNDSMATTLDQYSETLSVKKAVKKTDLIGMKKSAEAFRKHQDREEKLVQRFQIKTAELLEEVENCLHSKTVASE